MDKVTKKIIDLIQSIAWQPEDKLKQPLLKKKRRLRRKQKNQKVKKRVKV